MENFKINKISYYKIEDLTMERASLSWLKSAQVFIRKQLVDKQQQLVFKPVEFPDCLDVAKTCVHCDLHNTSLCVVANCLSQDRTDKKAGYFIIQSAQPV